MATSRPVTLLRSAIAFAERRLPPGTDRVPGPVLALYRQAAGVDARAVAERLDVTRQRVSTMEAESASIEQAGAYRAAVDMVAAEKE